jgi:hypothetical protein
MHHTLNFFNVSPTKVHPQNSYSGLRVQVQSLFNAGRGIIRIWIGYAKSKLALGGTLSCGRKT